MKAYLIDRLWKPTRLGELANRKIVAQNEKPAGFSSKVTKVQLVWKRTTNLMEIRFRANASVVSGGALQLILSRDEVFRMSSRFLRSMSDEEFIQKIRRAGDLEVAPSSGLRADVPAEDSDRGESGP